MNAATFPCKPRVFVRYLMRPRRPLDRFGRAVTRLAGERSALPPSLPQLAQLALKPRPAAVCQYRSLEAEPSLPC
jgi:hypothetical protein